MTMTTTKLQWEQAKYDGADTYVDDGIGNWTTRGPLTLTQVLRQFARGYDHNGEPGDVTARATCLRSGDTASLTFGPERS